MSAFDIIYGTFCTLIAVSFCLALPAWFITSLVLFLKSERGSKRHNVWRGNLIASSIVNGVIISFVFLIAYIGTTAVTFM